MPQQDNYLAGLQVNVAGLGTASGNIVFAALFNELAQDNVVAAGTNQATAFACTAQTIRITSAAAGSGILLPPSAAGLEVLVINHAANAIQVYGRELTRLTTRLQLSASIRCPTRLSSTHAPLPVHGTAKDCPQASAGRDCRPSALQTA